MAENGRVDGHKVADLVRQLRALLSAESTITIPSPEEHGSDQWIMWWTGEKWASTKLMPRSEQTMGEWRDRAEELTREILVEENGRVQRREVRTEGCSARHPDTGNLCIEPLPHDEHRAMGTQRLQWFGDNLREG